MASLQYAHSLGGVHSVASADASIEAEDDVRPLVTVVVPVRDAGSLDRLVDALERQSLDPSGVEVLIADDGSTDGSTAAAGRDAKVHIRVLTDRPVNSYAARNRGIASARGTVVAYCDSTIAFPLFCEYAVGSEHGRRPRKALVHKRQALVADLLRQATAARESSAAPPVGEEPAEIDRHR